MGCGGKASSHCWGVGVCLTPVVVSQPVEGIPAALLSLFHRTKSENCLSSQVSQGLSNVRDGLRKGKSEAVTLWWGGRMRCSARSVAFFIDLLICWSNFKPDCSLGLRNIKRQRALFLKSEYSLSQNSPSFMIESDTFCRQDIFTYVQVDIDVDKMQLFCLKTFLRRPSFPLFPSATFG